MKPITFARFFKAIEKFFALKEHTNTIPNCKPENLKQQDYIFVRENRKQVKVMFENILYVESIKDYIKIITTETTHIVKERLKSLVEAKVCITDF